MHLVFSTMTMSVSCQSVFMFKVHRVLHTVVSCIPSCRLPRSVIPPLSVSASAMLPRSVSASGMSPWCLLACGSSLWIPSFVSFSWLPSAVASSFLLSPSTQPDGIWSPVNAISMIVFFLGVVLDSHVFYIHNGFFKFFYAAL